MNIDICPGCRASFIKEEGMGGSTHLLDLSTTTEHPYIGASASCWNSYGRVLAHEFNNPAYFVAHRITVDAYCAQHPGNQKDRRARQSATLHAIALYLFFEQSTSIDHILTFLKQATAIKRTYAPVVLPLSAPTWLTVQSIDLSLPPSLYQKRILEWGESVWKVYKPLENDLKGIFFRIHKG